MTEIVGILVALAAGAASALVPLVNAEAYAVLAAPRSHAGPVPLVLALAVGQTAGKLVLFESARRGARRWAGKLAASRWSAYAAGPPVVLAAATIGLPPLAVVSLAAGAGGQSRGLFAALVMIGRTARFGALVLPATWVLS